MLTEADPENPPAWYGLGRSYESLSGRAFDKLQEVAPQSSYSLALLAETRLRDQQFSSAFYLYRRALEEKPTLRGLHRALAEIYRQTEHPGWAAVEEEKESQLPSPDCAKQTPECDYIAGRYRDRKSTRLNSSHGYISYAVFCLKKKKKPHLVY